MWSIEKKYVHQDEFRLIYRDYSEARVRRQYSKYKANLFPTEIIHLIHGGDILEKYVAESPIIKVI